jgi:hypothetical protein
VAESISCSAGRDLRTFVLHGNEAMRGIADADSNAHFKRIGHFLEKSK